MMKNKIIILLVTLISLSCVALDDDELELVFYIVVSDLESNPSGYYRIPINKDNDLTKQPIYAYVGYKDFDNFSFLDAEDISVSWFSNLYYQSNDNAGYYRKKYGENVSYTYVSPDTRYIFNWNVNTLTSTVDPLSKSDKKGMAKININFPPQMLGDTLVISAATFDEYDDCERDSCWTSMPFIITK